MMMVKFQYDGKWYALREDGKVKREKQFFFQKGWVINGFIIRDEDKRQSISIRTGELFGALKENPVGKDNPINHLKGSMINGSTGGKEGFRKGKPIEFIYSQ